MKQRPRDRCRQRTKFQGFSIVALLCVLLGSGTRAHSISLTPCVELSFAHALLRLRGGWRPNRDPETWGRGPLHGCGNSPTRAGEEGFAPRSFAHRIRREDLRAIPGWAQAHERSKDESKTRLEKDEFQSQLVIVPDHASTVPEAVLLASAPLWSTAGGARRSGGQIAPGGHVSLERQLFVKSGFHEWRGVALVSPQLTLHAFASNTDQRSGRHLSEGVTCHGRWLLEPKSQGSLANFSLTWGVHRAGEGRGGKAVVMVMGHPWVMENCDVLCDGGDGEGGRAAGRRDGKDQEWGEDGASICVLSGGMVTVRSCLVGGIRGSGPSGWGTGSGRCGCGLRVEAGGRALIRNSFVLYCCEGVSCVEGRRGLGSRCVVERVRFEKNLAGLCVHGRGRGGCERGASGVDSAEGSEGAGACRVAIWNCTFVSNFRGSIAFRGRGGSLGKAVVGGNGVAAGVGGAREDDTRCDKRGEGGGGGKREEDRGREMAVNVMELEGVMCLDEVLLVGVQVEGDVSEHAGAGRGEGGVEEQGGTRAKGRGRAVGGGRRRLVVGEVVDKRFAGRATHGSETELADPSCGRLRCNVSVSGGEFAGACMEALDTGAAVDGEGLAPPPPCIWGRNARVDGVWGQAAVLDVDVLAKLCGDSSVDEMASWQVGMAEDETSIPGDARLLRGLQRFPNNLWRQRGWVETRSTRGRGSGEAAAAGGARGADDGGLKADLKAELGVEGDVSSAESASSCLVSSVEGNGVVAKEVEVDTRMPANNQQLGKPVALRGEVREVREICSNKATEHTWKSGSRVGNQGGWTRGDEGWEEVREGSRARDRSYDRGKDLGYEVGGVTGGWQRALVDGEGRDVERSLRGRWFRNRGVGNRRPLGAHQHDARMVPERGMEGRTHLYSGRHYAYAPMHRRRAAASCTRTPQRNGYTNGQSDRQRTREALLWGNGESGECEGNSVSAHWRGDDNFYPRRGRPGVGMRGRWGQGAWGARRGRSGSRQELGGGIGKGGKREHAGPLWWIRSEGVGEGKRVCVEEERGGGYGRGDGDEMRGRQMRMQPGLYEQPEWNCRDCESVHPGMYKGCPLTLKTRREAEDIMAQPAWCPRPGPDETGDVRAERRRWAESACSYERSFGADSQLRKVGGEIESWEGHEPVEQAGFESDAGVQWGRGTRRNAEVYRPAIFRGNRDSEVDDSISGEGGIQTLSEVHAEEKGGVSGVDDRGGRKREWEEGAESGLGRKREDENGPDAYVGHRFVDEHSIFLNNRPPEDGVLGSWDRKGYEENKLAGCGVESKLVEKRVCESGLLLGAGGWGSERLRQFQDERLQEAGGQNQWAEFGEGDRSKLREESAVDASGKSNMDERTRCERGVAAIHSPRDAVVYAETGAILSGPVHPKHSATSDKIKDPHTNLPDAIAPIIEGLFDAGRETGQGGWGKSGRHGFGGRGTKGDRVDRGTLSTTAIDVNTDLVPSKDTVRYKASSVPENSKRLAIRSDEYIKEAQRRLRNSAMIHHGSEGGDDDGCVSVVKYNESPFLPSNSTQMSREDRLDSIKYRVNDVELLKRVATRKYIHGLSSRMVDYHC